MKVQRHRLCVLIAALLIPLLPHTAVTQEATQNLRDPRLREGQMFVVRLVPAGKKLEVFVTGKEVAELNYSAMSLQADLRIGNRTFTLKPKRTRNRFLMERPAAADAATDMQLDLKVRLGDKTESFELPVPGNQPK